MLQFGSFSASIDPQVRAAKSIIIRPYGSILVQPTLVHSISSDDSDHSVQIDNSECSLAQPMVQQLPLEAPPIKSALKKTTCLDILNLGVGFIVSNQE
jgi:hypothetical protein